MSDLKAVVRDLGGLFIIIALASLGTLLVPLYFGEFGSNSSFDGIGPILITSAIFFGIGLPFYYLFRKADPANFKTAMVTAALGWFFVSLIGSIPLFLVPYNKVSLVHMDFLSAFFESMAGWTGTGLSLAPSQELLPYTFQFWRTFIQWVGGVGVILLTLSILARPGTGSFVLYKGEGHTERTHPSIVSTARTIWWIFLLYTIIGISALMIIGVVTTDGMSLWESLNHAMTGLATGGFSVTDDSIAGFGTMSQIVIVILMIAGAIAFAAHYDLLKGKIRNFLSDTQLKALIFLIILGVIALTILNLNLYEGNTLFSLKQAGFQFTSAITCTGFSSDVNLANWSDSAKLILSFAMIVGGAAGSTAGGIKLFRVILLYKGVSWRIKRDISTPRRVFIHKLGHKKLSKEEALDLINEASIISFMWVLGLAAGAILLLQFTPPGTNLTDAFFEVCSAQGNVGLSTGITSIHMVPEAKAVLIFNMWIGRLEIIPIIVLVKSIFGIKRNVI